MIDIHLTRFFAGHQREKHAQRLACPWIALHVSGLRRMRISSVEGETIFEAEYPGPYVFTGLPGMHSDFEYGPDRENWVAMLEGDALQPGPTKDEVLLQSDQGRFLIPVVQALPRKDVPLWQDAMRRIHEAFLSPTPQNRLLVQLRTLDMVRRLLELGKPTATCSPAHRLKQLIDNDTSFASSLAELSRRCRYSSDHLRILFKQAYGVGPQEYRRRRRMTMAWEWIAASDLSVKEIATQLGFSHVSHFSAAFRSAFDCTVTEAIRRSRHGAADLHSH